MTRNRTHFLLVLLVGVALAACSSTPVDPRPQEPDTRPPTTNLPGQN
jgi:hypothetical protein